MPSPAHGRHYRITAIEYSLQSSLGVEVQLPTRSGDVCDLSRLAEPMRPSGKTPYPVTIRIDASNVQ